MHQSAQNSPFLTVPRVLMPQQTNVDDLPMFRSSSPTGPYKLSPLTQDKTAVYTQPPSATERLAPGHPALHSVSSPIRPMRLHDILTAEHPDWPVSSDRTDAAQAPVASFGEGGGASNAGTPGAFEAPGGAAGDWMDLAQFNAFAAMAADASPAAVFETAAPPPFLMPMLPIDLQATFQDTASPGLPAFPEPVFTFTASQLRALLMASWGR
jgi:hypothetical protein